jgi:Leu/Phe-tRNA-protein transferase
VTLGQPVETAPPETWENRKLGVVWTKDARALVLEAPLFVRRMIRRRIEQEAAAQQLTTVTADLVERCERKYRRS